MNIDEKHGNNLPTVRIAKIVLNHFKSVKHGEIIMSCGKKFVPYGTKSDILGIYGQNGSGKTSIIEAIAILKCLMSGRRVPDIYADCIDVSADCAELEFTFDFQYPDNNGDYMTNSDIRKVVYSFKLEAIEKKKNKASIVENPAEELPQNMPVFDKRIRVFDEVLKVGGTILGEKKQLSPFLDSRSPELSPETKTSQLIGESDEEKRIEIHVNKRLAGERSQSFLFMHEMMDLYDNNSNYSVYYQMMLELRTYARLYLLVFDAKTTGLVNLSLVLPIALSTGFIMLDLTRSMALDDEMLDDVSYMINAISAVLCEIVPGLHLEIKKGAETLDEDGDKAHYFEIMAIRNGVTIPLRCESDGVRKLIATLNCLIAVYNRKSYTVAYDEFDSGIFEYLLGEILQVLQSSGKGQFIFTSHNMRPLEVLNKDFVCFTTTDPDNRYIKLKNIGKTNNLRRVYYREIAVHENYDNLYNETKRTKIVSAFRKSETEMY